MTRAFFLAALAFSSLPRTATAGATCIRSYFIDHTRVEDDHTILFVMRDRTVYRNVLPQRCVGLRFDPRGFTYEATDPGTDEICSDLVTIRLNTSGNVCMLGAFERISAPARP